MFFVDLGPFSLTQQLQQVIYLEDNNYDHSYADISNKTLQELYYIEQQHCSQGKVLVSTMACTYIYTTDTLWIQQPTASMYWEQPIITMESAERAGWLERLVEI
jgi:hypothetical protein